MYTNLDVVLARDPRPSPSHGPPTEWRHQVQVFKWIVLGLVIVFGLFLLFREAYRAGKTIGTAAGTALAPINHADLIARFESEHDCAPTADELALLDVQAREERVRAAAVATTGGGLLFLAGRHRL